ncbi:hypothetical protein ACFL1U_01395 [Patescibacteria group bacterium]
MLGDPDRPQFGEHIVQPPMEDKRRNAPLITFTSIGVLLIGGAVAVTFFFADEIGDLALLIFQIIFFIFIAVYITFAAFAVYHMLKYGFKGDQSLVSTLIFIGLSVALAVIGAVLAIAPV